MYSPITILEHTTLIHNTQHWPHVQYVQSYHYIRLDIPTTDHIENTQHWPHVQWVQSYHYFRPHHPHTEHTTLTTCPVVHSYHYFRPHHPHTEHTTLTTCPVRTLQSLFQTPPPTYRTHNTDHMSSMYSPITISDPTTHIWNTQYWPHVQYVQSYHYFKPHHPHMEHTTLTTCPVCTVLSLF